MCVQENFSTKIIIMIKIFTTPITQDSGSPIFPLYYTEMMDKGKSKAEEGKGSPDVCMPQKKLAEEDLKELNLPTAEEVPTVPNRENLTAEDMR
jgi:hypothetical protein